jgi:hypothetical protein
MKQAAENTARALADESSVQNQNNGARALLDEVWGSGKPSKSESFTNGNIKDFGTKGSIKDFGIKDFGIKGSIKDGGVKEEIVKGAVKDGGVKDGVKENPVKKVMGDGSVIKDPDTADGGLKDSVRAKKDRELLDRAQEKIDYLLKTQAILEKKLAALTKGYIPEDFEQPIDLGPVKDDPESSMFKAHEAAHAAKPEAADSRNAGSSSSHQLPELEITEDR